jgi:hypothetical protein
VSQNQEQNKTFRSEAFEKLKELKQKRFESI